MSDDKHSTEKLSIHEAEKVDAANRAIDLSHNVQAKYVASASLATLDLDADVYPPPESRTPCMASHAILLSNKFNRSPSRKASPTRSKSSQRVLSWHRTLATTRTSLV